MNIPAEAGTPDEKIAVCPPLFLLIIGLRSRLTALRPAGVYPPFQPLSVVSGIF